MRILRVDRDVIGVPNPNEIQLVLDDALPDTRLVTTALGFIFEKDQLLLSCLSHRGWDLPGGHLEPNETPEEALRREVLEETGADVCDLHVLGYEKILIHAPKPDRYRYPYPVSYQVFYYGRVGELHPFQPTTEALKRGLFEPNAAGDLESLSRRQALYQAARTKVLGN